MRRGDTRPSNFGSPAPIPGHNSFARHRILSRQFSHEQDDSLDAFDKQLLSELPSYSQHQQSQAQLQENCHFLPSFSQPVLTCFSRDEHRLSGRQPQNRSFHIKAPPGLPPARLSEYSHSSPIRGGRIEGLHEQPSQRSVQEKTIGQKEATHDVFLDNSLAANRSELILDHMTPVVRGIRLVPVSSMPDKLRSIFPHELLNAVQSKCFPVAFHTDDNLVLSAPTGSGKTLVMELAICRLLAQNVNGDFKVIYQAPTKALCSERYRDWNARFGPLGLQCAELTGDTEWNHQRQIQEARIIITTPEKWDSITRKWRDQIKLVRLIKLFLVDEIHTLREGRGATLEAVVSRMKSVGTDLRFVALSATVPNSEDIATWLGKSTRQPDVPAQREVFDESFRPTKLERHVYGFDVRSNDFGCEKVFMNKLPEIIAKHSQRKPTMIFCMTRKSASTTALSLATVFNKAADMSRLWPKPKRLVNVDNSDLKPLVAAGVAFHHAGLSAEDRVAIQQGFLDGNISIICSTSTLAVGINLPCYLVILQGTATYGDAGIHEYSDLEVMQMLGRAGRPQFETSACSVILTRKANVNKYQNMISGQELIESTLHRNLIEHLNAEIALGTVYDVESARKWLASTFLFVRLGRNPSHYHLSEEDEPVSVSSSRKEWLQQICTKDIDLLINHDCVERKDLLDNHDCVEGTDRLQSTDIGEAMARYCVKFETMKTFMSIPPKAKISEILSVLCQAVEFNDARFKVYEKSYYKKLNEATEMRYPIKVDIALTTHKVSILLQAELGGVDKPAEAQFRKLYVQHGIDKGLVFNHARRLVRCIIDCQLHLKDAVSARNALELGRSIAAGAWDNTPQQLREIPGIGTAYARKLAVAGINSLETFVNSEPERIDLVLGKSQPFGRNLLKKMTDFPHLRISVRELSRVVKSSDGVVELKMKAELGFLNESCPSLFKGRPVSVIFLAEDAHGELYDFRRFQARNLRHGHDLVFTLVLTKPSPYLRCSVMCEEIVGTFRYVDCAVANLPSSAFASINGPKKVGHSSLDQALDLSGLDVDDPYGDNDLDDSDLLAAESNSHIVEVVKDIDDYLVDWPETTVDKHNQESEATAIGVIADRDKNDSRQTKPPSQLDNGRWKCKHTCRDRGTRCKHKCCIEGVARPRSGARALARHYNGPVNSEEESTLALNVNNADSDPTGDGMTGFVSARSKLLVQAKQTPAKRARRDSSGKIGNPKRLQLTEQPSQPNLDVADLDEEYKFLTAEDCDWGANIEIMTTAVDEPDTGPIPFLSLADLERPAESSVSNQGVASVEHTDQPQNQDAETSILAEFWPVEPRSEQPSTGSSLNLWPSPSCWMGGSNPTLQERTERTERTETTETTERTEKPDKAGKCLLGEEEERKKWEGIDPWLYEQYHDLVELYD